MLPRRRLKETLAAALDRVGLNEALHRAQVRLLSPLVRAVNYHDVPPALAGAFEAQLRFFAERYTPIGLDDLRRVLAGTWRPPKPGLIVSFDDGLRSHAEVAAPLLERYGFPGWFFVPVGFVDAPPETQPEFARVGRIDYTPTPGEPRAALTWAQVRALDAAGHVVGGHSWNHRRLGDDLDAAAVQREIPEAKARLERELGHPVAAFAWVGGEETSYGAAAARAIRAAGFELVFGTNNRPIRPGSAPGHLDRTHLEADFPPALVRFQLSGVLDLSYWPKRRRVGRRIGAG